jgi:hypothetical protein
LSFDKLIKICCFSTSLFLRWLSCSQGAERPYFVTYDHHLEEPGSLEFALVPVWGIPRAGNQFVGAWTEFEYGVKAWWTTELYLTGQSTQDDSTISTGFRWENRFRLLPREHWINPVFYIEYENSSEADKTLKEIVGMGPNERLSEPNGHTRAEKEQEIELKLILSSNFKGWNLSENFISSKSIISSEPWGFGYAIGLNRPLALKARPEECKFCAENFRLGAEFYGGFGTYYEFGPSRTCHFAALVVGWDLPNGTTFRLSPSVGLTENSPHFLLRFGISHEIPRFGSVMKRMFRQN